MNELLQPDYETLIFHFRGFKVMIDADLATLYGALTKRLKEQVKRNISRFPEDFMFELTKEEKNELVANCDRLASLKHSNVNPMAFTEQGVSMLSSVLSSEKAIKINIEIMRSFARYRALLRQHDDLRTEIQRIDDKVNNTFQYLLERIDAFHQKENAPRKKIGFKTAEI